MLKVSKISKSYGSKSVLRDLDLKGGGGEIIGIKGPNGAGKSTLLRALSTQLIPDSGNISFLGQDINLNRKRYLRQIGFMPSLENSFFPRVYGEENLELFARLNGMDPSEFQKRLKPWKELPSLKSALETRYIYCSTGMKQILSLCRALIHEPKLVLLDEPMKSVDEATSEHIIHVIKNKVRKTNCTVILVTHIRDVLESLATTTYVMNEGKLDLLTEQVLKKRTS